MRRAVVRVVEAEAARCLAPHTAAVPPLSAPLKGRPVLALECVRISWPTVRRAPSCHTQSWRPPPCIHYQIKNVEGPRGGGRRPSRRCRRTHCRRPLALAAFRLIGRREGRARKRGGARRTVTRLAAAVAPPPLAPSLPAVVERGGKGSTNRTCDMNAASLFDNRSRA